MGPHKISFYIYYSWFLLLEIIFVIPNKLVDTASNEMLISNIWKLKTNNASNNQILISIILIIRPGLAFVGSKSTLYPTLITMISGSVLGGGGGVSESKDRQGCATLALEVAPKNLIFT